MIKIIHLIVRKKKHTFVVEHEETQFQSKKIKLTVSHAELVGVACEAAIRTIFN